MSDTQTSAGQPLQLLVGTVIFTGMYCLPSKWLVGWDWTLHPFTRLSLVLALYLVLFGAMGHLYRFVWKQEPPGWRTHVGRALVLFSGYVGWYLVRISLGEALAPLATSSGALPLLGLDAANLIIKTQLVVALVLVWLAGPRGTAMDVPLVLLVLMVLCPPYWLIVLGTLVRTYFAWHQLGNPLRITLFVTPALMTVHAHYTDTSQWPGIALLCGCALIAWYVHFNPPEDEDESDADESDIDESGLSDRGQHTSPLVEVVTDDEGDEPDIPSDHGEDEDEDEDEGMSQSELAALVDFLRRRAQRESGHVHPDPTMMTRCHSSLVDALGDPRPQVRAQAALGLGDVGGPEFEHTLLELALEDSHMSVRLAALQALEIVGGTASVAALTGAYDGNVQLQWRARETVEVILSGGRKPVDPTTAVTRPPVVQILS